MYRMSLTDCQSNYCSGAEPPLVITYWYFEECILFGMDDLIMRFFPWFSTIPVIGKVLFEKYWPSFPILFGLSKI